MYFVKNKHRKAFPLNFVKNSLTIFIFILGQMSPALGVHVLILEA